MLQMSTPYTRLAAALMTLGAALPTGRANAASHPDRVPARSAARRAAPVADSIPLVVTRLMGPAGDALVSNAIPLRRGALRPDGVGAVRLMVEGQAVDAAIQGTAALHADGSLRSVVVQFRTSLRPGDRAKGWLVLGGGAGKRRGPALSDLPAYPEAVALPTNADYLISTDLVGETISVSETRRLGGVWAKYERDFDQWSEKHWLTSGADWAAGNYYDRAQIYYAWWVRTGNIEYWRRATLMVIDYRTKYLEKNNYTSSHHWSQLEGVALHYLLTGDPRSREAVERTAQLLSSYYRRGALGKVNHQDMESRIQARSLLAALLAWEVQNGDPESGYAKEWAKDLPLMLGQILKAQRPDGSFLWGGYCTSSINYMNGILNDVLIRYYTRFRPDSVIVSSVRRNADWLWGTQWRPDGSFNYQSISCQRNNSGPSRSPDLNGLFVTTYGWLYQQTGDGRYRDAADQIFSTLQKGTYLQGSKQFNQLYTMSYRYLAYRRGSKAGA
ncbi:MAG: hypothetical protein U0164_05820 [Gemmatimonadaceae bacterium]